MFSAGSNDGHAIITLEQLFAISRCDVKERARRAFDKHLDVDLTHQTRVANPAGRFLTRILHCG